MRHVRSAAVLGLVLVAASTVASCSSGSSDDAGSTLAYVEPSTAAPETEPPAYRPDPDPAEPTPTPDPPSPQPAAEPLGKPIVKTITAEDSDGYSQTGTLKLWPHVYKVSDDAAIQSAWEAVGGEGSVPCVDGIRPEGNQPWPKESLGVAFATVELENHTQGFDAENAGIGFALQEETSGLWSWVAVGYSRGAAAECNAHGSVSPKWESDKWGPVPLVITIGDVFSPKHPDGDPKVLANYTYVFKGGDKKSKEMHLTLE